MFLAVVLLAAAVAVPAQAAFGGPDAVGYSYSDSAESDGFQPSYNFVDVRTNGTALVLKDDQVSGALNLGFDFTWYNRTYTAVHVSSNGFLSFDAAAQSGCCEGGLLPDPAGPNATVAAYWADLNPHPDVGASVHHRVLGSAPDRVFVVQFTNAIHTGCTSCKATFQVQLQERGQLAQVHYQSTLSNGAVHSIGFEDHNGTVGLTYLRGTFLTDGPANGSVVQFAPNRAPTQPVFTGPASLPYGSTGTFSAVARDPERLALNYTFAWGDGTLETVVNNVASGAPAVASHSWIDPGTYTLTVRVSDHMGFTADTTTFLLAVTNGAPSTPSRPSGPTLLAHNATGTYTTVSTDPEGRDLTYRFDWGDGTIDSVVVASGVTASATHAWTTVGGFTVTVTAEDEKGAKTLSESLSVTTTNTAPLAPLRPVLQVAPHGACLYLLAPGGCQQAKAVFGTSACDRVYAEALDLSGAMPDTAAVPRIVKVPYCIAIPPDPDDDTITVSLDWGDGTTQTLPAFREGSRWYVNELHGYTAPGTYLVKATAKDSYGVATGFGPTLTVIVS